MLVRRSAPDTREITQSKLPNADFDARVLRILADMFVDHDRIQIVWPPIAPVRLEIRASAQSSCRGRRATRTRHRALVRRPRPEPGAPNYAAGRLIRRDDASGFETRGYGRLGEVIRTDRSLDVHIPGTDPSAPHSVVNATTRFHELFAPPIALRPDARGP